MLDKSQELDSNIRSAQALGSSGFLYKVFMGERYYVLKTARPEFSHNYGSTVSEVKVIKALTGVNGVSHFIREYESTPYL